MSRNEHNVRRFEVAIDDIVAGLHHRLREIVRDTGFVVAEQIVVGGPYGNPTGTPVDTGNARGQWTPSLIDPAYSEQAPDPTGTSTANDVARTLLGYRLGDSFWLTNGAAYINALETGWSKQAPLGMVHITVANGRRIVEDIVQAKRGQPLRGRGS